MKDESNKIYISWEEVLGRLQALNLQEKVVYGVPKNGMILAGFLDNSNINCTSPDNAEIIIDIIGSGLTKNCYEKIYPHAKFIALFDKNDESNLHGKWLVMPWEKDHVMPEKFETLIEDNIVRQLQYIGEDINREGLLKTPSRVVKSFDELYSGYNQDPKEILTTFEADGYNQIILLKDCELYSMCEHHMLPFFGKAHVAYIPSTKIVGISKLARLVEIFARRLQIQERICEQVTTSLMEILMPQGAACIIEAQHTCMLMRGVQKQNSIMITSSLKGTFLEDGSAKEELLKMINL